MKKLFVILMFVFAAICSYADEYTVEVILEKEEAPSYTYALDDFDKVSEVEYILWPTKLDEGKYKVNITRKDADLYRIDGTDFYIRTKYCYRYCYSEEVILVVYTGSRYSYGKVIFID
jgi:hypothetical protein